MNTIKVPTKEQVTIEAQAIFDQIQKSIGKVPNLYATIGYSSNALKGYLGFEEQLGKGVFTPIEREAISLVVSEVNNCLYCLSAHTLIGSMKGLSNDEMINIRKGTPTNPKLKVIVQLAKSITENKGKANNDVLKAFFDLGYNNDAVIEIIGLVAAKVFTNYVYALTDIPVDFPPVEQIV
jgi:uncharacterized peroxidase-related enzyme